MSNKEIDMSDFPLRANRLVEKSRPMVIRKNDGTTDDAATKEKEKPVSVVIKRGCHKAQAEAQVEAQSEAQVEVSEKKLLIQPPPTDVDQHQFIVDIAQLPAVQQSIREKIRGYRMQDAKKNRFEAELFVDFDFVVSMLDSCATTCYYCRKGVCVVYEKRRDKRQWTIERIDNNRGHNKDNVEIACLHCNLARCTVSSANYVKTKRLSVVKRP
jgi:hypothetical protein